MLNPETLDLIKRLTIIALVSDDSLLDRLVLKGGNAIRFTHSAPVRQSLDLDFSIDGSLGDTGVTQAPFGTTAHGDVCLVRVYGFRRLPHCGTPGPEGRCAR
ncbi:MAG: nucleotidyl transferase AbiEii/AbiGii toxin family protein [Phycisphaeraceae bacterium]|nr:nucleotidyl transferase AbiEii/AbiGii toxin family protein [Phycisphaeraceae bacterium]